MNRKIFYWKLRDSEMQLGERTLLMGVLNITPDSFSDGGRFNDPDRAYARALEMEEQGADIIDIGAESTRPGSKRITADEEWQRLVPVLKRLRGNLRAPLSLDTYKAEIAERALQYGVEIINDPSGLTFDPGIAKVAANGNAGLILNHMRGQPETWAKLPPMPDPSGTVARELDATANRARHAGVDKARIIVDPGLGFGKRKEQNAEILAHLAALAKLDLPILIGPSRKSFLAPASEGGTVFATAAAVAAAVLNGAHIVRVHDVKEMQAVVQVADEIARAAAATAVAEERQAARVRTRSSPNIEAERPRPPRPPIARPQPPKIDEPARPAAEEIAPPAAEQAMRPAAASDASAPAAPRRENFTPPAKDRPAFRRESRFPDREKRDGSLPPRKPFTPRRDEDGGRRSGPPPRGRDFRQDRDRPPRRDDGGAKPRGFKSDREFRPRDGKPGFKSGGFKPRRPFDREGNARGDRPEGSGARPRSGPPRSGPPRSGPPKGKAPGGGPSKRPFRKRP